VVYFFGGTLYNSMQFNAVLWPAVYESVIRERDV